MAAACKTVLSCDLGIRNLALCKFGVSGGRVVTVHHASVHDIVAEGGCSARNCKSISQDRMIGYLAECLSGLEGELLSDPPPQHLVVECQPGRRFAALASAVLMWGRLRVPGLPLRQMSPLAKFNCVGGHGGARGHAALKKRAIESARGLLPDGELEGRLLNDHLADCVLQACSLGVVRRRGKKGPP